MMEFSQGPVLWQAIAAVVIFAAAYIFILIERWERMYTALGGAVLMIVLGIVPIGKALTTYANWRVLMLLASLFIIAGLFQKTGLISYGASRMIRKFRLQPFTILVGLSLLTAISSALWDSLVAIAVIVPIVMKTAKMMKVSPVPFLISVLLSAHIGGASTLMGNLPNRLIGEAVDISAADMLLNIGPLSLILLAFVYIVMWFLYGKRMIIAETGKRELLSLQPASYLTDDRTYLIGGSLIASLTLLALLLQNLLGWHASYIAASGAILFSLLNYKSIVGLAKQKDWLAAWITIKDSQLLFFFGLFVMVGGLIHAGFTGLIAVKGLELSQGNVPFLTNLLLWLTAFGSAMMDYIPYTAAMIPVVKDMSNVILSYSSFTTAMPLWWSLLIGTAIGSGVTLLSSTTSMYAAVLSDQEGGGLTQRNYFLVAAPISLLLCIIATIYFNLFLL
ncbi:membrane protein [Paenibacillus marchantiophytorum]|uniref:Membrane protein n=1 Tax=Paenibacillus marchantiophytorum TaxID=1619310 RepID=A0ABQ1ETW7_9BACL|nr:SLC13 family permease [Paenibacillus marchantiophytorum]GFZ85917.1 membrane protein [Paenibacillus marchantiophytorum]